MTIGTVPLFQAMSAWFVVFERHFGWSRTELSIAFVLYRVEGSILGPVSGYLIDKLGPRRNVLIGLALCGAGFLFLSWTQELWHFYAAFVVITVGIGLGTWMPMMTVLNHWFDRHRAMAMAVAIEGFPDRRCGRGAGYRLGHRPRRSGPVGLEEHDPRHRHLHHGRGLAGLGRWCETPRSPTVNTPTVNRPKIGRPRPRRPPRGSPGIPGRKRCGPSPFG